jgi:hypothetical protein
MRPVDVAHKVAWVAKEADQLCTATGDLLLSYADQTSLTELQLSERAPSRVPERFLLDTAELGDFVRNVIQEHHLSLCEKYAFPVDNVDFANAEGRSTLDLYLPATYYRVTAAPIWGGDIERGPRVLRPFNGFISCHQRHPGAIKQWAKHVLDNRPASVVESSPKVAEGYAVVVNDTTGSVALGLLEAGFRKIYQVFTPECVEGLRPLVGAEEEPVDGVVENQVSLRLQWVDGKVLVCA